MPSPTGVPVAGLAVVAALAVLYLLPALIALARGVPGAGRITRLTLLAGWTGVGWLVALARAVSRPGRADLSRMDR